MTIRIKHKLSSAVAALALSAIFIGAAVGPAVNAPVVAAADVAVRSA